MQRVLIWGVFVGLLGGCGGSTGAGDASDAEVRDVLAPDLGAPPTCLEVCSTYRQHCGEAVLLRACDECTPIVTGASGTHHPENFVRAVELCNRAEARQDCKGLAGCLADKDGLTGVAMGARITLEGQAYDVPFDLVDEAAVAVVGAKAGGGGPSDLLVYFVAGDTFYELEIDDLGADAEDSPLSAAENPVTLDSVSASVNLEVGTITLAAFDLEGGLDVGAELAPPDRPDDLLRLHIVGEF